MNPYQQLFEEQKKHFRNHLKNASVKDRIGKLKRIRKWMADNEEFICSEINKDFKKCKEEVLLTEIKPVVDEIKHSLNYIHQWTAQKPVDKGGISFWGTSSYIKYEPKGTTLIIAPWNYPFNLCLGPLVSAITAGCNAIIKPSEHTPHTSALISKLIKNLFKEEEFAVITGDYTVSQDLLKLPFDHIFFTGSPQVGKIIMKAAAEHLTSVTLELGGRNPLIFDKTGDVKDAASKIIWGKYMNAGQTCISINYLYVHESKQEALIAELKNQLEKIYQNGDLDYTHIVNSNHYNRIKNLVEETISQGAEAVSGNTYRDEDNYIAPTILKNVTIDHPIFQEEIFGPVLPIITYTDTDQMLGVVNEVEKPLSLYIFSKSTKNTNYIINNTSAGSTVINDTTIQFAQPNLPFGGVNHSGIGKAHGEYGFLAFSNERAVLKQRLGFTMAKLAYPPYTSKFKKWLIRFVTWRI